MSKIEVNAVEPQSGTTLTLGASGDTVTLAAGASQSGFGRTGTVDWDTTKKTTGFTAVSGIGYFCDTTSAAFTVTLPATPSAGAIVGIADYANTSATNNITVGRNGSKIDGENKDAVIFVNGQVYTLVYVDATEGWKTVSQTFNQITLPAFVAATGGTITTCGDFKIHAFTGPGTFCVSAVGNAAGSNTVQTLIVAGGGGGGKDRASGGGAGGLILTPSAGIPVSVTAYPISIGGGGPGGTSPFCGTQGTPTTGFSLTSVGGGKGSRGGGAAPIATTTGGPGGSGGGGSVGCGQPSSGPGGPGTQPTQPGNSGTYGFGNNGGSGGTYPVTSTGGGGGANAVGGPGTPTANGAGGAGKDVTSIFGASPKAFYGPTNGIYAGGGGGGQSDQTPANSGGLGGSGGGGPGGKSPANGPGPGVGEAGTTNTGGGGGGGANTTPTQCGGAGGSGIVLIRYKYQ
jgi:hypothetical protein